MDFLGWGVAREGAHDEIIEGQGEPVELEVQKPGSLSTLAALFLRTRVFLRAQNVQRIAEQEGKVDKQGIYYGIYT